MQSRAAPLDRSAWRRHAPLLVLLLLVAGVYRPLRNTNGDWGLAGIDFHQLHERRIAFAQEQIREHGRVPGWNPREFLGAPFRANIQSFPFIPTRLVLLGLPSPSVHGAAVMVAALLAAGFTYAFAASVGLGAFAAAVAAFTFAISGFFVSRVYVGHLPLLEAYPALPLLLWLIERTGRADAQQVRWRLGALGASCGLIALAGHPQVPIYALGAAAVYAAARSPAPLRWRTLAAMALGVGMAGFSLVPMLGLIARSTRVLPLDRAPNDLALPWGRLLALVLPFRDGAPSLPGAEHVPPFSGYPTHAYFWDCVNYIGILPLIAVLALVVVAVLRRAVPPPASLLAAISGAALLLALPPGGYLNDLVAATILRSPARLMYVTTFGLAMAAGALVHVLLRSRAPRGMTRLAVAVAALAHGYDMWSHARHFLHPPLAQVELRADLDQWIRRSVGDGRVAIDSNALLAINRRIDDVGFFDSIILARPYQAMLQLDGQPSTTNIQDIDGSRMQQATLARLAARLVVTFRRRPDLRLVTATHGLGIYEVAGAAPRVAWVEPAAGSLSYSRPSSDLVRVQASSDEGGRARILEAFDPGWSATVDGLQAPVAPDGGFAMSIAVPPGRHEIEMTYSTPGALAGAATSMISALALLLLCQNAFHRPSGELSGLESGSLRGVPKGDGSRGTSADKAARPAAPRRRRRS